MVLDIFGFSWLDLKTVKKLWTQKIMFTTIKNYNMEKT